MISTPVQLFQHEAEFKPLLDLYCQREPQRVLEIGTYHGGTLYHWLQNAVKGALVVSVDSYEVGVDNRHLYSEWVPEGVFLDVIEGRSEDPRTITRVSRHAPYDWIFIDAGHYYHEVKADWENYGSLGNGVVCFHDILLDKKNHPEIEVAFLWKDIQEQGHETQEIIANGRSPWGGIGVVYL